MQHTQHTATRCNTLQYNAFSKRGQARRKCVAVCCSTLQLLAAQVKFATHSTNCNTLQHAATHCNRAVDSRTDAQAADDKAEVQASIDALLKTMPYSKLRSFYTVPIVISYPTDIFLGTFFSHFIWCIDVIVFVRPIVILDGAHYHGAHYRHFYMLHPIVIFMCYIDIVSYMCYTPVVILHGAST